MLKFAASTSDGHIVGLGLSEENIRRLQQGHPIIVRLREMLPDSRVEILIFAGTTEAEMTKMVGGLIGPETKVQGIPPA